MNSSMKVVIVLLIVSALSFGFRSYGIHSEISARTSPYAAVKEETCSKTGFSSDDIKQLTDVENIEITGIAISKEGAESLIHIKYMGTPMKAKEIFNELSNKGNLKAVRNIIIQNEGQYIKVEADIEYFANNICK